MSHLTDVLHAVNKRAEGMNLLHTLAAVPSFFESGTGDITCVLRQLPDGKIRILLAHLDFSRDTSAVAKTRAAVEGVVTPHTYHGTTVPLGLLEDPTRARCAKATLKRAPTAAERHTRKTALDVPRSYLARQGYVIPPSAFREGVYKMNLDMHSYLEHCKRYHLVPCYHRSRFGVAERLASTRVGRTVEDQECFTDIVYKEGGREPARKKARVGGE